MTLLQTNYLRTYSYIHSVQGEYDLKYYVRRSYFSIKQMMFAYCIYILQFLEQSGYANLYAKQKFWKQDYVQQVREMNYYMKTFTESTQHIVNLI